MPLSPWQAAHDTDSSFPLVMSEENAGFIGLKNMIVKINRLGRNFMGLIITKYEFCAMNVIYVSCQLEPLNVFTIRGTLSFSASDINLVISPA